MKLIIAGSKKIEDRAAVFAVLDSFLKFNKVDEVVSGMAVGVDTIGVEWATANNIPVTPFHPDWKGKGKLLAGFARNHEMGDYADVLIAFWDGKSGGTEDMIDYMHNVKKKRVRVIDMPTSPTKRGTLAKISRTNDLMEFME